MKILGAPGAYGVDQWSQPCLAASSSASVSDLQEVRREFGSAGHTFGIVTSFIDRLPDVGPTVYGGLIPWPADRNDEILPAYRSITTSAPRELPVFTFLRRAPPASFLPEKRHGKRICATSVCYSRDLTDAKATVAPIRERGNPVVDLVQDCQLDDIGHFVPEEAGPDLVPPVREFLMALQEGE